MVKIQSIAKRIASNFTQKHSQILETLGKDHQAMKVNGQEHVSAHHTAGNSWDCFFFCGQNRIPYKKIFFGAEETVQQIRTLAAPSEILSSIPRTHV